MQRYLSLISTTEQSTGMQRACGLFQNIPHVLWITQTELVVNPSSQRLPASKARTVLGQEYYLVVFDAWSGLDVNALAAVVGTIRAGGTLVLLTPTFDSWPEFPDPDYKRFLPYPWLPEQLVGNFIRRFVALLQRERERAGEKLLIAVEDISAVTSNYAIKTTADQQRALALLQQATEPVVLNADRGRGKSALLGMLAKQYNAAGQQVVLTAPSRATIVSVLQHAQYEVTFCAPDDLLQTVPAADVLLVDEAAAIPLPMLLQMLQHYPRCVFSTTLQGYEGSGRGFVLRFQRELACLYPDWLEVKLQQPIRWREGDWLEGFVNEWLVLDRGDDSSSLEVVSGHFPPFPALAKAPFPQKCPVQGEQRDEQLNFNYQQIPQATLVNDEVKLRQIFQLLINAHYQTRPSDLRQMLDAPHITLHVIECKQQVIAVALLAREGELEPELTVDIHAGKRRPHGHLLPQSLTFHAGIPGAACLHCERVMRIAVAPEWQRQGIGRLLLDKLCKFAEQQQADYLGVSYALSPEVLAFWQCAGFESVRLGYRKDKASGSRSLMQILGLSKQGKALAQQATHRFKVGLPELLKKLGDVPGLNHSES
ncbi:MAG: tRNA(Met) cytidine acetyltransferase TmcA [Thiolinea sp.]